MSSSLLSKSLGEVKNQEKPVNGRGGARPNRNSPYAVSFNSFLNF